MLTEERIREIVREELAALAKPVQPQKGNRGTRLAPDFEMPLEWLRWACDKRFWTDAEAKAEGELFCDYWTSRGGVMVDWRKCWQTWVRNSKRPDGHKQIEPSVLNGIMDKALAEHYAKQAALYDRMGRWQEAKDLRKRIGA